MRNIFGSRLGRVSAAVAVAALGVFATATAEARPWHYYHHGWYGNPNWALNAWAGTVAGAAIASTYYNPYRYYYPPAYYPAPAYGYYYNPYYGPEPTYGLVIR
jgi:hypothetical protein